MGDEMGPGGGHLGQERGPVAAFWHERFYPLPFPLSRHPVVRFK